MKKIVTIGKRVLKDDRWHDANGLIQGTPADWDPPMTEVEVIAGIEMIAKRSASRPVYDDRTPEEIIDYDEFGVPR